METTTLKLSGSLSAASTLFQGKYQQKVSQELSPYQRQLYNQCLKGFSAYSYQELKSMTAQERVDIMTKFSKTQQVLNTLKQQALTNTVSVLFSKLFPNANGSALPILMFPTKDKFFRAQLSLKELGITRTAIIKRLVAENILSKEEFQIAA